MTKKQNKLKGLFCKWLLLCSLLLSGTFVNAQMRVGGSTTPDQNAILDLNPDANDNADKGLLLPRVKLVATDNPAPLTAHTKGMYVFNTITRNDVKENALYYNDGTKWQKVVDVSSITGELGDTILNYITNNVTQELTDSILAKMNVTSNSQTVDVVRNGSDFDLSVNINNVADSLAKIIINSQLGDSIISLITNNINNPTYNLGDEILNYITNNINNTYLGDTILQYITNNFPAELGDTILQYITNNVTQELTDSILAKMNVTSNDQTVDVVRNGSDFDLSVNINNVADSLAQVIINSQLGDSIINLITNNIDNPTYNFGDEILNYITNNINNTYLGDTILQYITNNFPPALSDTILNYIINNVTQELTDSIFANVEGIRGITVENGTGKVKIGLPTGSAGQILVYDNKYAQQVQQLIAQRDAALLVPDYILAGQLQQQINALNAKIAAGEGNEWVAVAPTTIQTKETVTTLADNGGTYTYTSEDGTVTNIDVVSDIYNYGDTLLSNTTFIENLITNNQFLDSITNVIKQDETVTTLDNNSDGTYTYTSEDGTVTKIDVVSDIYNYGDTLLSNTTFIENLITNNQFLDSITNIIKQDETVTTLTDNADGTYTYTSEDGTVTSIDVVSDIYNYGDTLLSNTTFIENLIINNQFLDSITNIIKQDETVTTLTDNADGTYTYTSEDGTVTGIDVVSDIYNYGDTLLSNTTFIENLITNNQFLDSITNVIKQDETVTTLTDNADGTYTYTSEDGTVTGIDVVSDIYNYGDTLLSNTTFIENLITNNQFLDSITNIIKQDETVTTLDNNSDGTYTYTNENGDAQKIDVVSDIYNYGDTLLSNTTFIDSINKIVKAEETVTNVSGSNGVYTYTNENGDA
ncbi:MAG: hypothetical protein LBN27_02305, partial [Prevotellaceae bacterium]|nr:hypothetical protein [Prevotellaceae bacterium]